MPRSLTIPPGSPTSTRERFVDAAPCLLEGRAWSGWAPIERVEVSVDGGATWEDAELGEQAGERAWRGWSYAWDGPAPASHVLLPRDRRRGNVQPWAPWNLRVRQHSFT